MSKKPVPKKRLNRSSGRSRSSKYDYKQRTRLTKATQLTKCSKCGEQRRVHYACLECGFYRGRQVINVKAKTQPKAAIEA